jgi:hypothetical protein
MRFKLFLLLLFISFSAEAQKSYDFNSNCKAAHEAIMALQFKKAKALLWQERKVSPQNLIPIYLDNYIDFLTVVISEEKVRFEQLKGNKAIRLEALEQGDKNSPFYLLTQAEINLQWAFARIKFNEYLTAALEVNRAYKMLEENQKKFPDFILTKKCLGLLHAAVGTIPDEYKWALKLFGFAGSIKQGENEVKQVFETSQKNPSYSSFKTECALLLSVIELNLANAENYVTKSILPEIEKIKEPNPLLVFCYAGSSIKLGKTDEAIAFLEKNKFGKDVFAFPYLNYMLGQAKLTRLDTDANLALENFLKSFKGINFVKAANLRLAWFYLIKGNAAKYRFYLAKLKSSGAALVDEDKQAKLEAESGDMPTVGLLKSRLLFDGGYYDKSLVELKELKPNKLTSVKENLELVYRMARIHHKKNDLENALLKYQLVYKNGSNYPYYFAANAALHMGYIYEQQNNKTRAKESFLLCLNLKDHEYQNSISQKAKAGINRLEN